MKKLVTTIVWFQVVMTLVAALVLVVIFVKIEDIQTENITLKNDLNDVQAKIRIMEEIDNKLYAHVDTLGGNDLMLQSWLDEVRCMIMDCNQEWNENTQTY